MWSEDKALEEDERTSAIAKRSSQGSRPTKMLIEGLCSASDGRKRAIRDAQTRQRRQLAQGARNRARQAVVAQVPALIDTTSPLSVHRTNTKGRHLVPTHRYCSAVIWPTALGIVPARRLEPKSLRSTTQQARCQPTAPTPNAAVASFRLTGSSAPSAGPRRSESCPSGKCRSRPCTQRHNKPAVSPPHQHQTPPSPRPDSQAHQRRQLAHGARNRSSQATTVEVPAPTH